MTRRTIAYARVSSPDQKAQLLTQAERLVLVTKDRLLRFGAELVFSVCAARHVEVVVLDEDRQVPREQQLTGNLVEILTAN